MRYIEQQCGTVNPYSQSSGLSQTAKSRGDGVMTSGRAKSLRNITPEIRGASWVPIQEAITKAWSSEGSTLRQTQPD